MSLCQPLQLMGIGWTLLLAWMVDQLHTPCAPELDGRASPANCRGVILLPKLQSWAWSQWDFKNWVVDHIVSPWLSKSSPPSFILQLTNNAHQNPNGLKLVRRLGLRTSWWSQTVKRPSKVFGWKSTDLKTTPGCFFSRVGFRRTSGRIWVKIL